MGLDMYLTARKYVANYDFLAEKTQSEFSGVLKSSGFSPSDLKYGNPSGYVLLTVGYWRKANAIHKWFVDNVQDGVDECQTARVNREQLEKLQESCDEVLANASKAPELLPTQGGFFFGETEYDEWYHDGVKHTSEMLKALLANPKFSDCDFEYNSSW